MPDWLSQTAFLHIPTLRWLLAAVLALGGGLLARTLLGFLAARLHALASRTGSIVPEALASGFARSSRLLLIAFFALLASRLLELPEQLQPWLDRSAFLLASLQVGLWANASIRALTRGRLEHGTSTNPVVTSVLGWFARILVWATLLLLVLSNLGVNITAFVASLGIGGIAIALALQNILGDLFASLSIGLDKPFAIGDFISFDGDSGTVLRVGVKTTRIRTQNGEEISIGNAALLGKTIRNFARLQMRGVTFRFGLALDTPHGRLREVLAAIEEIVGGIEGVRLERAHFRGFGDSSLDFEVLYTVSSADFRRYLDVQQQINLELMARLEALGVELAMPLRRLRQVGS